MLVLELGLGQMFQRGHILVMHGLHPRLTGVGYTNVFVNIVVVVYYEVIVGWCLVYMYHSLKSGPMPWTEEGITHSCGPNYHPA